jgi:hypothetical protein
MLIFSKDGRKRKYNYLDHWERIFKSQSNICWSSYSVEVLSDTSARRRMASRELTGNPVVPLTLGVVLLYRAEQLNECRWKVFSNDRNVEFCGELSRWLADSKVTIDFGLVGGRQMARLPSTVFMYMGFHTKSSICANICMIMHVLITYFYNSL